ncbi:MAG: hypothetical protein LRY36_01725 [Alphaproteobacteria bacterium]|nr:hypothetical protein [Alphaproteobacteria bacterium]
MDIKELPHQLALDWAVPEASAGRHLSTEIMPLTEYLAMRKRIGGRNAFMPKTNFAVEPLDELKNSDSVMQAFNDGYVFSSYSMEPETLLFLKSAIEMYRPRVILELGSGLSTLVLSAAQQQMLKADNADGVYVSVEQSQEQVDKLAEMAGAIGLKTTFKPVVCPLVRYKIGDFLDSDEKAMPCYDFDEKALHEALGGLKPDMIIIDGPADEKTLSGASFAKTLTMPLLSLYAAPGAVVLMDGCYADPEVFALEQWQESGIANIVGVKAVGKGLMVALANG